MYKVRIHLTKHFSYHRRLIHCGKMKVDNHWIYAYKDVSLASIEETRLYEELDLESINKDELDQKLKKAGMILIRSNMDVEPDEVYNLYKSRDLVEKHFETFKSELSADKIYLNDSFSVFGHFFIAFLALYLYCKIMNRLKKADLNSKHSPKDLLLKLSKVFKVDLGDHYIITEVPKQVRNIAEQIKLDIIPII